MSGYLGWKGWGADGFGVLTRGDKDYFARETRDLGRLHPPASVLEIGYGNGAFLAFSRSVGWNVTGTELLPELVELARAAGYQAFRADELDTLPDGSFDLVAAFDVFEHVPPEASVAFLRSLSAKLAEGGVILLRFPNADSWIGNPFQHGDVTHVNAIGVLKLEFYAAEAGLSILRIRGARRRGFQTSVIHGLHAWTAGVIIKCIGAIAKALYFPDLPVVLSSSNVVTVLGRAGDTTLGERRLSRRGRSRTRTRR
ncbi:SAM-dependent methyltransferase [Agromyces sp. 3263]|uniref:class I SAM-dependent methyltransferase n=1 Tax=Agromyces sp. 3263 TaxID=2817750 RepID=UPI00285DCD48|nr:class I SAM-dependent methyltransferase [Agromyces sp. 3263]MDR6904636.1 SAM-dependent methyltransferase [Agromyces sp. 3263]